MKPTASPGACSTRANSSGCGGFASWDFPTWFSPGATHSRFAHSIGVYHTARLLADLIDRRAETRDPDRKRVALLAAILHDIGHGPFSHAFEAIGGKRHEQWSMEIIRDDTEVHRVLREADDTLPEKVSELLNEEDTKDIYGTIVSSQFDADRIDYMQRDRMAAGVKFGHFDRDWLFDCLEVGSITIGQESMHQAQCLYLGPKGVSVAEEYLEARFRLYKMVYMHKTTRAAEKMLEALLGAAARNIEDGEPESGGPALRYLARETPSLGTYLDLDDAAVWSGVADLANWPYRGISTLARRLRDRNLYKCIDVGAFDEPGGNLFRRLRHEIDRQSPELASDLFFDDPTVTSYRWYDFDDSAALNKVLVKTRGDETEPKDIVNVSPVVKTLRDREHIYRVYAPDQDRKEKVRRIMEGMRP